MLFHFLGKRQVFAATVLSLSLVLASCEQSTPTKTLDESRNAPTIDIVVESPPINYGKIAEQDTSISAASMQNIAQITVTPPSTILTQNSRKATFYAEGFDSSGRSIGKVPYEQLLVEEVNTTGAEIYQDSINSFAISIPSGEEKPRNIVVRLKENPAVVSSTVISSAVMKPGVFTFTDSDLSFPKPTTNYATASIEVIEAELGAFTLDEYFSAAPSQVNQLNMPFVIRTKKPIQQGSVIHVGNSAAMFGKIKTIESRGDEHLVTLSPVNGNSVIENFDAQMDAIVPSEAILLPSTESSTLSTQLLQTDIGKYCVASSDIIAFTVEAPIQLSSSVVGTESLTIDIAPKFSLTGAKGGGTIECETPPISSPSMPLGPYFTGILSLKTLASAELTNELGNITLQAGLDGHYDAFNSTNSSFEEYADLSVNAQGKGIDDRPASANISVEVRPQKTFSIRPLPAMINNNISSLFARFSRDQDFYLASLDLNAYLSLGASAEYLNARKAFDESSNSSAELSGKIGVSAETSGFIVDWLEAWHFHLPTAVTDLEIVAKKSKAPELKSVGYEDDGSTLDISLEWSDNSQVTSAVLGDEEHDTSNSLHKDRLEATYGTADYDESQCSKGLIEARILGFGNISWDNKTILENAPIGTDQKVKGCLIPKLSAPEVIYISAPIGKSAEATFDVSNTGQVNSILDYEILTSDLYVFPNSGRLKSATPNLEKTTHISHYCEKAGSFTKQIEIVSRSFLMSSYSEDKKIPVNIVCSPVVKTVQYAYGSFSHYGDCGQGGQFFYGYYGHIGKGVNDEENPLFCSPKGADSSYNLNMLRKTLPPWAERNKEKIFDSWFETKYKNKDSPEKEDFHNLRVEKLRGLEYKFLVDMQINEIK